MTIDTNDMLNSILASISRIDYIKPEDIPGIDLYMDQVTTFMDNYLRSSKRYSEDKILTKTMINNYAKNHLLPPPEKKKYSRAHILMLVFIYYFKNILSIGDIQTLLAPLSEKYFKTDEDFDLKAIYNEIIALAMEQMDPLKKDIVRKSALAGKSFEDADISPEDREFLEKFAFICMLSFDVYIKKQVIEKLIDDMPTTKK